MDRFAPIISTLDDPALRPAVARFAAGLPARLEAVAQSLSTGDDGHAVELVHKLAGAAGMHGFLPVAEAARRVEHALRQRDTAALAETLAALRAVGARVRAA